eukprot:1641002-Alexandrium_andersonii.AAC.1
MAAVLRVEKNVPLLQFESGAACLVAVPGVRASDVIRCNPEPGSSIGVARGLEEHAVPADGDAVPEPPLPPPAAHPGDEATDGGKEEPAVEPEPPADRALRDLKAEAASLEHLTTRFPKNP